MEFFVPSFAPYAGKDVVIVGGGDSAFDWALHLEPIATLGRRWCTAATRSAPTQRTVEQVRASPSRSSPRPRSPRCAATATVESVEITVDGEEPRRRPARPWSPRSASSPTSARSSSGGSRSQKRHVVVDSAMRTNLPRVFAAGDITEYPGKVRLIAVGFGEAATAVNNAAVAIDPTAHVFPGHSSEGSLSRGAGRDAVAMSDDGGRGVPRRQPQGAGGQHRPRRRPAPDHAVLRRASTAGSRSGPTAAARRSATSSATRGSAAWSRTAPTTSSCAASRITGRAELVREPDRVREIGSAVAVRMVGAASIGRPRRLRPRHRREAGAQAGRRRRAPRAGRQLGPPQDGDRGAQRSSSRTATSICGDDLVARRCGR